MQVTLTWGEISCPGLFPVASATRIRPLQKPASPTPSSFSCLPRPRATTFHSSRKKWQNNTFIYMYKYGHLSLFHCLSSPQSLINSSLPVPTTSLSRKHRCHTPWVNPCRVVIDRSGTRQLPWWGSDGALIPTSSWASWAKSTHIFGEVGWCYTEYRWEIPELKRKPRIRLGKLMDLLCLCLHRFFSNFFLNLNFFKNIWYLISLDGISNPP